MGDTNARTGTEYECIDNNNRHIPVPFDMRKTSFIRKRKSQNLTVCPRGKDLLDLCIEATSFQYNGNSALSQMTLLKVYYFFMYIIIYHTYLTMLSFRSNLQHNFLTICHQ